MNCHSRISKLGFHQRETQSGFTLVEIAIALGVIGFALVAIIGILPMGLEVQRDNRSETIINQDAQFWMEALRSGALDADQVLEFTERIQLIDRNVPAGNPPITNLYRHYQLPSIDPSEQTYDSVSNVIGLLTWPAAGFRREAVAQIKSISGAAVEKELDPTAREVVFAYLMRVVIEPRNAIENDLEDLALPFVAVANEQGDAIVKEEHFGYPDATSLFEIRLAFLYPFIRADRPPPRAQNFRASVSRSITNDQPGSVYFYFRP